MARLIYTAIASLDGYVADEHGDFEWSAPDEEVHTYINDLERGTGTLLLGRRMYEVLAVWDNPEFFADQPAYIRDFAKLWQAADKIVYSRTLETVSAARTRIERNFEVDAIRALKARAKADIGISGPELAAHAFEARLIDEVRLFLSPIIVGGGRPGLPRNVRLQLELSDERRFASGVVHLRYRTLS